jgi:molybdopterin synthase sulfur carrier subunit
VARVRLRLFAAARDAAGRTSAELDAVTLGDALDAARADYGPEFAAVLASSRVWVNGDEPADGDASILHDGDELAVVPPVSGGVR